MATQASNLSFIDNTQGQITISATTATTSTTTGALIIAGGVGIGGTVYVGSLRGDTTTSATTWGLFYNPVTKEITTATSGSGAGGISSTGTTSTFVISSTASSTSTNTGALQVVGGVGIGGSLFVGGVITATNFFAGTLRIDAGSTMTNLVVTGTATSTSTVTGAVVVIGGVGIGGTLFVGSTSTFTSTSSSTSTTTGALIVTGGVGIGGGVVVGGAITATSFVTSGVGSGFITGAGFISASTATITSTIGSTSTTTGALIVTGGVGIGGALYVANTSYVAGAQIITTATIGLYAAASAASSTGTTSTFIISNTTGTVSTTTGALQVAGGVGIGGNLYVGGVITATNFFAGTLRIDAGSTMTNLVVTGTDTSTSTTTGAIVVAGGVGVGGNLNVGRNISRNSTTATTTHPLEIIGSSVEPTVLGAFRSLSTASSSLISFQNTSQVIVTVASNTGSVLLVQASSQYLSIASNATLALGSGDFTIEGFYYITQGTVPDACLIDWRNGTNGSGVTQPLLEFQPSGSLGLNWYVNASNRLSSTNTPVLFNTWQHFALSRVSGSTRMYLSGSQVGSTYTDANNYPQGSIFIGHANDGALGRYFPGYISNIRIIVGTGLYSGATLTVPTANLTSVTNTKLLLNTVFGGSFLADSSGAGVTVTNNNGATSSANSPVSGTVTTTYNDLVNIGSTGSSLILQTNAITRVIVDSTGTVTITSTASSTSTTTGALIVTGGVGIGGGVVVGGVITATTFITAGTFGNGFITGAGFISASTATITSTIGSTSTTTGALIVTGGVGIGGNLYVASTSYIAGAQIITTATIGLYAAASAASSTGTTSTFVISNTTGTISTTTGALQVAGGVGIGGGIVAGGVITGTVHLANGSLAGSTNIGAFTYGTLTYSDSYNLAALQSNNNGYIQLVVQNTNAGTAASGDIVISNNLGTFNTYYGNLGMNSSAFTGVGSFNLPNAVYLASSQGDLVLGSFSLNSIRFTLNSAAVDAITISTVSNSVIINNTATITATTASVSTNTGALTVAGGVGIAGGVYIGGSLTATSINTVGAGGGVISGITQLGVGNFTATGIVSISGSISSTVTSTNTASSVSTTTGALVVAGGVGIGGNLNVGGVVTATSLVTTGAGNGIITGVGSISTVNLTASGSITATNIYTVGSGVSTIVGLGLISTIASTVTGLLLVTSSTAATSTSTGAVRIAGGVGVGGSIYSQGMLVTTTSTGIGYTTGSGNTTTQITSRTTPVTVNGLSGYVALFSAAGSTTVASFQVNNPSVLINDVVIVTPRAPTANTYISAANSVTNGSFNISVWASGGVAVEAPIINFAVIKGSIN